MAQSDGVFQQAFGGVKARPQNTMPPVEQIKAKRSGTGLRALDVNRACPGFTLFAPQSGGGTVYLIDLEGNVTHTWQMPYPPGNSGYLTESGTLFYNGKILEDSKRFISGQPWKGGAALEVDWNGRVLSEVRQPDHHHDGIRLRNANLLLICLAQLPQDLVPKIKGGMPGTEHNGQMYADYLVEMTTDGRIVWEWRTWEHLDPETDCITAVQDQREAWTHGNGVGELPNGDIVLSFRNISTVIIIDRKTGEIIWKLGAPPLSGQHAQCRCPMATCFSSITAHTGWIIRCRFHGLSKLICQPSRSFGSTRREEKATSSAPGYPTPSDYPTATR
jgi:Arylsulfotransferase (ASST)